MTRRPKFSSRSRIFTIGYEQAKSDAVLSELAQAKIALLVDLRAVAASRRPGFSKRQLAAGLDERGIGYLHLRGLGTPKEGRLAAHGGDVKTMLKIYEKHLKTPEAREQLDELATIVQSGRRVCLLCYERDMAQCHRQRIAELLHERTGLEVEHLVPPLF
jgi:uncharacterized protein (DUF488 family)